jgi:protein-disulfide isomerase
MLSTRRTMTLLTSCALAGGLFVLSACNPAGGGGSGEAGGGVGKALSKYEAVSDFPVGSPDAKVVIVEYASVTCPHCANFHNNVLPTLKEKYIKTGKVRYVFREFPTPPEELAMAGHAVARCAGGEKRDLVIETIMRQQMDMVAQAQGPTGAEQYFKTLAASVGMNEQQFKACLSNETILKVLVDVRQKGIEAGVKGTPTIFINGTKFEGRGGREIEVADITPAIDAALAK